MRALAGLLLLAAFIAGLAPETAWAQSASIDGITGPASVPEPFRTDDYINSAEQNDITVHGSASGLDTVSLTSGGVDHTATVANGKWEVSGLGLSDSARNSSRLQVLAAWTDSSGAQQLRIETFDVKLSGATVAYDVPGIAAGRMVTLTPSVDASDEPVYVRDESYPDLYPYSLKSGELPDGLALDRATGVISGIPETPGQEASTSVIEVLSEYGNTREIMIQFPQVHGQRIDNFGYQAVEDFSGPFVLMGNPPPALDPSLSVVRFPPEGPTGAISFASADTAVCTVDPAGALTLVAPGRCAITATAAETGDSLPAATAMSWFVVREPTRHLSVTPADDIMISGPMGGPFTPDRITYEMRRTGDLHPVDLPFGAVATAGSFLELRRPDGLLLAVDHTTTLVSESGSGGGHPVVAHVNAAARHLPPGVYTATVTFDDRPASDNIDYVIPVTRNVRLEVSPRVIQIEPVKAAILAGEDARFRVFSNGIFPQQVNVKVQLIGRWRSSSHVTLGSRWVTLPRGHTEKFFSVSSRSDGGGSITAQILPGEGYAVAAPPDNAAVVQVRGPDDRPTIRIRAFPGSITEGDKATFWVSADPPPLSDLNSRLKIYAQGNYGVQARSMVLTIPADQYGILHTVETADDGVDEPHGSVTAQVSCVHSFFWGGDCAVDFANDMARVTINDDDGGPEVHVSVDGSITEGETATFTLTTDPPGQTVNNVRYRLIAQPGSEAIPRGDFGARWMVSDGQGTIPHGQTGIIRIITVASSGTSITIGTDNDDVDEPYGQVTLKLLPGTGYQLSVDDFSTFNIYDDDGPPSPPSRPRVGLEPGSRLTVRWEADPGATGYEVQWGPAAQLARQTDRVSAPEFTTPPLSPGVAHAFQVAACNDAGCSPPSPEVQGTLTPPTADAGPDVAGQRGQANIPLAGAGAADAAGSQELTYQWRIAAASHDELAGLAGFLMNADQAQARFTVPRRRDVSDRAALDDGSWLDFELTVTDGDGETASDTIRLTIQGTTWTAERPANRAPVFADGTAAAREIAENSAAGVNVGAPVSATDLDGDTIAYALSGAYAQSFEIDSATGQLRTAAGATYDYETQSTYALTVSADDGQGGAASIAVTVSLTDVDESPPVQENTLSPTANAGPALTGAPGESVTLQGTGSDNPYGEWWEMAHQWAQLSGPTVTLTHPQSERYNQAASKFGDPRFVIPADAADGATLEFQLTVTDQEGESDSDTVIVTVVRAANTPPRLTVPAAQRVFTGATVELTGSATDAEDGANALSFAWEQTGGTPTVSLDGANTATASFAAPAVSSISTLTFRLSVTDTGGLTASRDATVTILPLPTACAGDDLSGAAGAEVTLQGKCSHNPYGPWWRLQHQWTQLSGPTVTLTHPNTERYNQGADKFGDPRFVVPEDAAVGTTLEFRLTVTDQEGGTDSDTVTVTVAAASGGGG